MTWKTRARGGGRDRVTSGNRRSECPARDSGTPLEVLRRKATV